MTSRVGDYILLETIGSGAFGNVKAAVHAPTGEACAVKVMDKRAIRQAELTLCVRREVAIMKALSHPNIVGLHKVLSSKRKIYVVLDIVRGGELFELISNQGLGGLPEHTARRYFKQLIAGVLYCHKKGVVHRDLKPENLLVDKETGLLKITDFGLSAIKGANTTTELLYTLAGTPNYLAPEVISRAEEGYSGEKVDAWACGIILFALLAGYLPFDEPDIRVLFRSIQAGNIEYPSWMSSDAVDLLGRLLDINPCTRWSVAQVRTHSWLAKAPSEEQSDCTGGTTSNRSTASGADASQVYGTSCHRRAEAWNCTKPPTPGLEFIGVGVRYQASENAAGHDVSGFQDVGGTAIKPPTPGLVLPSANRAPSSSVLRSQPRVATGITATWSSDRRDKSYGVSNYELEQKRLLNGRAKDCLSSDAASSAAESAAESAALVVSKSRTKLSSAPVKRSYTLLRKGVVNYSGMPGFQREHSKVTLGGEAEARRRGVIPVDSTASIENFAQSNAKPIGTDVPSSKTTGRYHQDSEHSCRDLMGTDLDDASESDVEDGCHSLGTDARDTVKALRRIQTVIAVSMRDLNAEQSCDRDTSKAGGPCQSNENMCSNVGAKDEKANYVIPDESSSDGEREEPGVFEKDKAVEAVKQIVPHRKLHGAHARRLRCRTTEGMAAAPYTLKRPRRENTTGKALSPKDAAADALVERGGGVVASFQKEYHLLLGNLKKRNLFEKLVGTVRPTGSSQPTSPKPRSSIENAIPRNTAMIHHRTSPSVRVDEKQTRSSQSSPISPAGDVQKDCGPNTSSSTAPPTSPRVPLDPECAATLKALRQLRDNINALANVRGDTERGSSGRQCFMSGRQRKETLRLLRVWEHRILSSSDPETLDEETSVSNEELLAFQTLLRQWDDQIIGHDRAAHELDMTIPGSVSVEEEIDVEPSVETKYCPSGSSDAGHLKRSTGGHHGVSVDSKSPSISTAEDGGPIAQYRRKRSPGPCEEGEYAVATSTAAESQHTNHGANERACTAADEPGNLGSSRLDSQLVLSMGIEGLDLDFGMGDGLSAFIGVPDDRHHGSTAETGGDVSSGKSSGNCGRGMANEMSICSGEDLNTLWGRVLVNNTSKLPVAQETGSPCSATTSSALTSPFEDDLSVSPHCLECDLVRTSPSRKASPCPQPKCVRQSTFDASDLNPPIVREGSRKRSPTDLGTSSNGVRRPVLLTHGVEQTGPKDCQGTAKCKADSAGSKRKSRRRRSGSSASGRLMAMLSYPLHGHGEQSRSNGTSSPSASKSSWTNFWQRGRNSTEPAPHTSGGSPSSNTSASSSSSPSAKQSPAGSFDDDPHIRRFISCLTPGQCMTELAGVIAGLGCAVSQMKPFPGDSGLRLIVRVPTRKNGHLSVGIEVTRSAFSVHDGGMRRIRDGSNVTFHINKRAGRSDLTSLGRFFTEVYEHFQKSNRGFQIVSEGKAQKV